jgi:hypothetical protein
MAEGTSSPFPSERQRSDEAPRGERSAGPREGGFRIRLSDNEMRSARALQEAFGLRSTVAVLGFALRTLGQQLEEGKLDELVALHRAQASPRGTGSAAGSGSGRPEGRRERPEGRGGGGGGRGQESRGAGSRGGRVDPFARPPRPTPAEADVEAEVEVERAESESVPDTKFEREVDATPAEASVPPSQESHSPEPSPTKEEGGDA